MANKSGILCVIGAILIHTSLGTFYTFGNMAPYISSYLHFKAAHNGTQASSTAWINSATAFCQGGFMLFGGLIAQRIGYRLVCALGCLLMSCGVTLTYFSIQCHLALVILTYGIMFGTGVAFSYSVAISLAQRFYPNKKGFVSGLVVGGYGFGTLIFNSVQTACINPENLAMNYTIGKFRYFNQDSVLEKVPSCFLILGGCYFTLQLIGILLLKEIPIPNSIVDVPPELKQPSVTEREAGAIRGIDNKAIQYDDDIDCRDSCDNLSTTDFIVNERNRACVIASPGEEHDEQSVWRTICVLFCQTNFWILWVCFFLNSVSIITLTSHWKEFGEEYRIDDRTLSIIGSVSSFFNGFCRILWGGALDYFSFKKVNVALFASFAVVLGTFPAFPNIASSSKLFMEVYFGLSICLHFAIFCGLFATMPVITSKKFGLKNFSVNYGILFTALAIGAIGGGALTQALVFKIGFFGIWELITALEILAAIIVCFFKE